MSTDTCRKCRGLGTGSWCQFCNGMRGTGTTQATTEPMMDCFGLPIVAGKRGTWVQMYSGRQVWPLSPEPEDIAIEDIAIGLSRECRYGKQCLRFYSVAEHSVIVSLLVGELARAMNLPPLTVLALEREGLLHDCDEGVLPDMPRPLKHEPSMNLETFRLCGKLYQAAAFKRFGINSTPESHTMIDTIDKRLVLDEVQQLMRKPELYADRHAKLKPTGVNIAALSHDEALELFLSRFADLFPEELT